MELREWLIILGLALVTLIVIDGVRRLQRQRRVPRLDRVDGQPIDDVRGQEEDPEAAAREAELNWELPNGGARVVRPASYDSAPEGVPSKPKLTRQAHPGGSRVLSEWQAKRSTPGEAAQDAPASRPVEPAMPAAPVTTPAEASTDESSSATTAPVEPLPAKTAPEATVSPETTPAQEAGVASDEVVAEKASGEKATVEKAADEKAASDTEAPVEVSPDASQGTSQDTSQDRATPNPPARTEARGEPRTEKTPAEPRLTLPETSEAEAPSTPQAAPSLVTDPADHDPHADDERYRLVDFEGMADSFKSGSVKMGQSMQRFGAGIKQGLSDRREKRRQRKQERERLKAEQAAAEAARRQQQEVERQRLEAERLEAEKLAAEHRRLEQERQAAERRQAAAESEGDAQDPLFTFAGPSHRDSRYADDATADAMAEPDREPEMRASEAVAPHPVVEKALRNEVSAPQAREALSHAEEVIVISVMCREEEGFSGTELLKLMLACGLRYSREMGIFHRFETEADDSPLQFSLVNVVKPGTFPLDAMDEFATPGITFLMPLPGAEDTTAAFEAMVECAMVVVRHLGGELKDENHSVMTAQTVEFARQKVQEFERRHRLQRYQVN